MTILDRNQIMRLALYVLGFTVEGIMLLETFSKPSIKNANAKDTPIPLPPWELFEDSQLWLCDKQFILERDGDKVKVKKRIGEETRKKKRRAGEPTTKKRRRASDKNQDDKEDSVIKVKEVGSITYTMPR